MTGKSTRWTLEKLVDFEQAAASSAATPATLRTAVNAAIRGLTGAAARRQGLRVWLDGMSRGLAGRRFASALGLVTAGLCVFLFVAGASAVAGLLDRERGGINAVLFLAILIGGQWLVLVMATLAWLLRRRAADGFSMVQSVMGKLVRRLSGSAANPWWQAVMDGGGMARNALLWRLARLVQVGGIAFNIGIVCGLAGLVLVKHVGFFWETTTEDAMRSGLEWVTRLLSAPWAWGFPGAVPDSAVIEASQWLPGRTTGLAPGPSQWWEFLLMSTLVWGLAPRAVLWLLAWLAQRKALATLDFQGRHHRALWRGITGIDRVETDEKPLDGVLVLDVGGSGLAESTMRPFLLRRLRVHPAAWMPVAVLDSGAEHEAALALADAPAGIVLLAEGWALSPPRMRDLHARIRASAGPDAAVKFLIANVAADRQPAAPGTDERLEWERFVDGLRDPSAEIHFYEPLPPVL